MFQLKWHSQDLTFSRVKSHWVPKGLWQQQDASNNSLSYTGFHTCWCSEWKCVLLVTTRLPRCCRNAQTLQSQCTRWGHNSHNSGQLPTTGTQLKANIPEPQHHCTARENRQPHDFNDFGFSQGYVIKAALSHQNPATPTTAGVCFKLARSSPRGSACPINSPVTGPPRPERPLGAWSAYSPVPGMLDRYGPQHPPRGAWFCRPLCTVRERDIIRHLGPC